LTTLKSVFYEQAQKDLEKKTWGEISAAKPEDWAEKHLSFYVS